MKFITSYQTTIIDDPLRYPYPYHLPGQTKKRFALSLVYRYYYDSMCSGELKSIILPQSLNNAELNFLTINTLSRSNYINSFPTSVFSDIYSLHIFKTWMQRHWHLCLHPFVGSLNSSLRLFFYSISFFKISIGASSSWWTSSCIQSHAKKIRLF